MRELYGHDKSREKVEAIKDEIVVCAMAPRTAITGFALLRDGRTQDESPTPVKKAVRSLLPRCSAQTAPEERQRELKASMPEKHDAR